MQRFPLAAWEQSRSRVAARRLLEHDAAPTVDFARATIKLFFHPQVWRGGAAIRPARRSI
jgi:hypothetical protein